MKVRKKKVVVEVFVCEGCDKEFQHKSTAALCEKRHIQEACDHVFSEVEIEDEYDGDILLSAKCTKKKCYVVVNKSVRGVELLTKLLSQEELLELLTSENDDE